jgi:hypothetical protein
MKNNNKQNNNKVMELTHNNIQNITYMQIKTKKEIKKNKINRTITKQFKLLTKTAKFYYHNIPVKQITITKIYKQI